MLDLWFGVVIIHYAAWVITSLLLQNYGRYTCMYSIRKYLTLENILQCIVIYNIL